MFILSLDQKIKVKNIFCRFFKKNAKMNLSNYYFTNFYEFNMLQNI